MRNKWSNLSHLQIGKYSEYLVIMELTRYGFDVYSAEVDDKGIDFVVRKNENEYFDIQVKSVRKPQYVYMTKEKFRPRKNLLLALVIFGIDDQEPSLMLIPSLDWLDKSYSFLKDYDFKDKKSKPEYGINITKANIEELKTAYEFGKRVIDL